MLQDFDFKDHSLPWPKTCEINVDALNHNPVGLAEEDEDVLQRSKMCI